MSLSGPLPEWLPHRQPWASFFQNDDLSVPCLLQVTATLSETFIPANRNCENIPDEDQIIHFYFHPDYLKACILPVLPVNSDNQITENGPVFVLQNSHLAKQDFKALQLRLTCSDPHADIICRALAHRFLVSMIGMLSGTQLKTWLPETQNTGASSLGYFLEANYTRKMTVAQLAAAMGQSQSTFKRNFAAIYVNSPMQWLIRRRLEYAYFLIRYTDYSITVISMLCGFGVVSHFAKSYKAQFGNSPLQSKIKALI